MYFSKAMSPLDAVAKLQLSFRKNVAIICFKEVKVSIRLDQNMEAVMKYEACAN